MSKGFRSALALNNIAISLAQRQCYRESLRVMFAADELMDPDDGGRNKTAEQALAAANHYLACWCTYAIDYPLLKSLKIVSDTDLVGSIFEDDFPQDMMHEKVPLKCYLVRFTGAEDAILSRAIIRFNTANLLLALNVENLKNVQQKAHTLLSLAFLHLDSNVYNTWKNDLSSEDYLKGLQFSRFLVLTLRCMVFSTDSAETSDAYHLTMASEFYRYQDAESAMYASFAAFPVIAASNHRTNSLAPAA